MIKTIINVKSIAINNFQEQEVKVNLIKIINLFISAKFYKQRIKYSLPIRFPIIQERGILQIKGKVWI